MVQIRELINPNILNSFWIGFTGDSEFIDKQGELQLGYWTFLSLESIDKYLPSEIHKLDDEIDEEDLFKKGNSLFLVKNDYDIICLIRLYYEKENN